jgi:hypothetical protein
MPQRSEYRDILKILQENADKSFVKRILERDQYPKLDLGDGNYATHKMAWAEADGKYYVFPTVLYDGRALKEYPWESAFNQVRRTGNFIEFDNPDEADWFSRRYKAVWGE